MVSTQISGFDAKAPEHLDHSWPQRLMVRAAPDLKTFILNDFGELPVGKEFKCFHSDTTIGI